MSYQYKVLHTICYLLLGLCYILKVMALADSMATRAYRFAFSDWIGPSRLRLIPTWTWCQTRIVTLKGWIPLHCGQILYLFEADLIALVLQLPRLSVSKWWMIECLCEWVNYQNMEGYFFFFPHKQGLFTLFLLVSEILFRNDLPDPKEPSIK